jgi:hypothetical protein
LIYNRAFTPFTSILIFVHSPAPNPHRTHTAQTTPSSTATIRTRAWICTVSSDSGAVGRRLDRWVGRI